MIWLEIEDEQGSTWPRGSLGEGRHHAIPGELVVMGWRQCVVEISH